ncbi:glycoside hydrolase family 2 TIM barrel-domain containing protein [Anaerohalosphaera lusitana]|uniref:glycoside hydrolase family 2 TIM barrel-domain containing protein n=1 Tax=Anaerohalosphaera lusitana TaxID=1936003 RepID=UPI0014740B5F|nr:glycoside hydrolase family 2 TIM barrel-domain containing protein [Anaerohalosphaera lusitana]
MADIDFAGQDTPALIEGAKWKYPLTAIGTDKVAADSTKRIVAFGEQVTVSLAGLRAEAKYSLEVSYLSDSRDRVQRLKADDLVLQKRHELKKGQVERFSVDLPEQVYADGEIVLTAEKISGPNAVIAGVKLFSNQQGMLCLPAVKAAGKLGGHIEGKVFNANDNEPLAGAAIKSEYDGQIVEAVSDSEGRFVLKLPYEWREGLAKNLKITCVWQGREERTWVPRGEIFRPRLTVRPVDVKKVDQPIMSLNGHWDFCPVPDEGFSNTGENAGQWYEIEVPGEWVMQGFAVEQGKFAAYRRKLDVPEDWDGQRVKLRFDGVYSVCRIWVNGQPAGEHSGGFTPFEVDVTDLVNAGDENEIVLAVKNESLADVLASGSQYAVHQLGGISRKVTMFAVPTVNVASMHVVTDMDEEYADAVMRVEMDIVNDGEKNWKGGKVEFKLTAWKDKQDVRIDQDKFKIDAIAAGQRLRKVFEIKVDNPRKWTSETPNLYVLSCELKRGWSMLEKVQRRIGFREIEVQGNQLLVNGKPVKLRGVNRHEAHPLRGRSLTAEQWRTDAELFKAANCNYIRTSHYPPAEEFIAACDEIGLFVEEEAPFCWVGHGTNSTWRNADPQARKNLQTLLQGTAEMIERDRSNPSVLFWSLANESQWGRNFERTFAMSNLADPSRPKAFHDQSWGGYNNYGSNTQIANFHYPGPGGPEQAKNSERPLLFGEYLHLNAYNRFELTADPGLRDIWGQGLKKMWDDMYATDALLGGAIWSGVDDTFFLPNGKTVGYGTWGPIDGWRRKKPEWWHVKKVYSPVRILEDSVIFADGEMHAEVENRFNFTNLDEVVFAWTCDERSGKARFDIPPRGKGKIKLPIGDIAADQAAGITIVTADGRVVDEYRFVNETIESDHEPMKQAAGKVTAVTEDGKIVVNGDGFRYVFDKTSGKLKGGYVGDDKVLTGGPELMLLPLNSGGDTQMTGEDEYVPFTPTCSAWKADTVNVEESENVVINVAGKYDEAQGSYRIVIGPDGEMTVKYDFTCLKDINPRQVGIVFDTTKHCDTLSWKRDGLWTAYPDWHIGRLEGSTRAFAGTPVSESAGPRYEPAYEWRFDCNELGTNDFRSTKENIYTASLTDDRARGLEVNSDGSQSVRAWLSNDTIRLLIADYINPGSERFYRRHARQWDRPLKKGDKIAGTVTVSLR